MLFFHVSKTHRKKEKENSIHPLYSLSLLNQMNQMIHIHTSSLLPLAVSLILILILLLLLLLLLLLTLLIITLAHIHIHILLHTLNYLQLPQIWKNFLHRRQQVVTHLIHILLFFQRKSRDRLYFLKENHFYLWRYITL